MRLGLLPLLLVFCGTVLSQNCPAPYTPTHSRTFEEMVEDVEGRLKGLAADFRSAFTRRCSSLDSCPCTHDMCSDSAGEVECSTHGGSKKLPQCLSSACDGIAANKQESSVHRTRTGTMQPHEKEMVCGTKVLDATFREIQEGLADAALYSYIGTWNGLLRNYPGQVWSCDATYDPRIRPWYRAASSGPKDVVIVVDKSGSMRTAVDRWQIVLNALNGGEDGSSGLLDLMSQMDFVSIVAFSSDAEVVGGDNLDLQRGTSANIARLKGALEGVDVSGSTNFLAGFQKAFDILRKSAEKELSSNCKRVIVFLTDGADSDCDPRCTKSTPDKYNLDSNCRCQAGYLEKIEELQRELEGTGNNAERASIFTYSMGNDADDSILRQVACKHSGAWNSISDYDDPLVQMSGFFTFLAKSVKEGEAFWSEPYSDWGTGQELSSVAMPVFENGDWKNLLGVVAIDVPPSVLLSNVADATGHQRLLQSLRDRSAHCGVDVATPCQLQMMRQSKDGDFLSCPADVSASPSCCFKGQGKTFLIRDVPATWADAETYCKTTFNGDLAVFGSSTENMHLLAGMAPPDGAWVGLKKTAQTWRWQDGQTLAATDTTVWASGGPTIGNCAFVNPRGGQANIASEDCTVRKPYLCEIAQALTTCEPFCNSSVFRETPAAVYSLGDDAREDKVLTPELCQDEVESYIRECTDAVSADVEPMCAAPSSDHWEGCRDQAICCGGFCGVREGEAGASAGPSFVPSAMLGFGGLLLSMVAGVRARW